MAENTEYKPFASGQYDPEEPGFYNAESALTVNKNDCPSGSTASSVMLTAIANQFKSIISQTDANEQALAWLNANAQAYANNSGICTLIDSIAPTTTSLGYSLVTSTTLTLSWTAATDNVVVVGYDIYINGVLLDSTVSSVLSYAVTGLSEATPYSFYVKANDAAGNSSTSNAVNITTPPSILTLVASKSVIFESQDSDWSNCKSATSADYMYTSNALFGAGLTTTFHLNRYRGIIDTSVITTKPKSAKVKFKFATNNVGTSLTVHLFASSTQYPINQSLQLSDWNDFTGSSLASVVVGVNSVAYNEIILTQNQIDLLVANQSYDFSLRSNGDVNGSDPGTNNRPELSILQSTGEVSLECEF